MSLPIEWAPPIEIPREEDWIHELHPDLQDDMDTVVALSGVRSWIKLFRAPAAGPLDIRATAENLGTALTFTEMDGLAHGETLGLPFGSGEPLGVRIDPYWNVESQTFTMGHEMGHIYLETLGYRHRSYSRVAEDFCDAVAREVVMPLDGLRDVPSVDRRALEDIVETYGVEPRVAILQLMRADKLPHKIAIDSKVGLVSNPKYAEKVCRHYICYECTTGQSCDPINDEDIPVFNFTDKKWWGHFTDCRSENNYFLRDGLRRALNKHYFPEGTGQLELF